MIINHMYVVSSMHSSQYEKRCTMYYRCIHSIRRIYFLMIPMICYYQQINCLEIFHLKLVLKHFTFDSLHHFVRNISRRTYGV